MERCPFVYAIRKKLEYAIELLADFIAQNHKESKNEAVLIMTNGCSFGGLIYMRSSSAI